MQRGAMFMNPDDTGLSPDVVSMLGQRRRRWSNIEKTSGQNPALAGQMRDLIHPRCGMSFCK